MVKAGHTLSSSSHCAASSLMEAIAKGSVKSRRKGVLNKSVGLKVGRCEVLGSLGILP